MMNTAEEFRFLGEVVEEGSLYLLKEIMSEEYGWNDDIFWEKVEECLTKSYAEIYSYNENEEFENVIIDDNLKGDMERQKYSYFNPLDAGFDRYNEIWPLIEGENDRRSN